MGGFSGVPSEKEVEKALSVYAVDVYSALTCFAEVVLKASLINEKILEDFFGAPWLAVEVKYGKKLKDKASSAHALASRISSLLFDVNMGIVEARILANALNNKDFPQPLKENLEKLRRLSEDLRREAKQLEEYYEISMKILEEKKKEKA